MQTLEAKHTVSQYDPLEKVLSQLHTVQFVNGRYRSSCPAHDDHTPSLSISEGHSGILLKCWAGCSLEAILQALGVEAHELFYDHNRPSNPAIKRQPQAKRYNFRAHASRLRLEADILFSKAEKIEAYAAKLDTTKWSDADFSTAWGPIATSIDCRLKAERLEEEAFEICAHGRAGEDR